VGHTGRQHAHAGQATGLGQVGLQRAALAHIAQRGQHLGRALVLHQPTAHLDPAQLAVLALEAQHRGPHHGSISTAAEDRQRLLLVLGRMEGVDLEPADLFVAVAEQLAEHPVGQGDPARGGIHQDQPVMVALEQGPEAGLAGPQVAQHVSHPQQRAHIGQEHRRLHRQREVAVGAALEPGDHRGLVHEAG